MRDAVNDKYWNEKSLYQFFTPHLFSQELYNFNLKWNQKYSVVGLYGLSWQTGPNVVERERQFIHAIHSVKHNITRFSIKWAIWEYNLSLTFLLLATF